MMLCIAMAETNGREALSVIVDDQTTIDYLITSIPVDVHDGIVMVALSIPRRAFLVVHPAPTLCQLVSGRVYIECHKLMTCINATTHKDARLTSVKIGSTKEELTGAVTIAVTPSSFEIRLASLETGTREVDNRIRRTCRTITVDQELLAIVGKPLSSTRRCAIVGP